MENVEDCMIWLIMHNYIVHVTILLIVIGFLSYVTIDFIQLKIRV